MDACEKLNKYTNYSTETSEENKIELNNQGRYVFVVHDWNHLVNKLRNRFPKSVFVGFHDSLPTKVDGCVLLTKHIYHSLYYRAKDYYNKIGVPVIHIHSSNVDVISETMSKEFAEVG